MLRVVLVMQEAADAAVVGHEFDMIEAVFFFEKRRIGQSPFHGQGHAGLENIGQGFDPAGRMHHDALRIGLIDGEKRHDILAFRARDDHFVRDRDAELHSSGAHHLRDGLAANQFQRVIGIMNGTCNYILTKMTQEGADFTQVLKKAQELGYAEADPTFDIEGVDTAHKLCLLLSLCFGTAVEFNDIHTEGISSISAIDINFAREFGYKIKLLAIGKRDGDRIEARVHPTMIPVQYPLADVDGAFNAIRLTGDFVGPVMFYGRGAGMEPTASAVMGDVIEISRNILAGIGRRTAPLGYRDDRIGKLAIKPMGEIVSKYYIRFSVEDKPGVLARLAGELGQNSISIESMIQSARSDLESVPIVIMTHEAREMDVRKALEAIDSFDITREKSNFIRIEDNLE